jgi:peptidoglycan hydrolase-like protein with peptidoglycan-binding domain
MNAIQAPAAWASATEVQSRLIDLGYYDGPVNGKPCRQTILALTKFQRDQGLPATGQPDPVTMQTLRESYCF